MSTKKHRFFSIFSSGDVCASLDGFSSVLEVYPDSDLRIEASALVEAATTFLVEMKDIESHTYQQSDLKAYSLFVETLMDKDALSSDWHHLGEDFASAYDKVTSQRGKPHPKDATQSWSKLTNAR